MNQDFAFIERLLTGYIGSAHPKLTVSIHDGLWILMVDDEYGHIVNATVRVEPGVSFIDALEALDNECDKRIESTYGD